MAVKIFYLIEVLLLAIVLVRLRISFCIRPLPAKEKKIFLLRFGCYSISSVPSNFSYTKSDQSISYFGNLSLPFIESW